MDSSFNQPVNPSMTGAVNNGQGGVQPAPVKKSNKKALFICLGSIAVLGIVALVVFLATRSDVPPINFEEDNKLDKYSLRATEVDPTDYTLDDDKMNETESKAEEYLDGLEMQTDELLSYFKNLIKKELDRNNTDEALRLLWREHDLLAVRGLKEEALQILLDMDTSKLVNFQKAFLYRSIVTASYVAGKNDIMEEYSALVQQIDPDPDYSDVEGPVFDDTEVPAIPEPEEAEESDYEEDSNEE